MNPNFRIPIVDLSLYETDRSECVRQLEYACENMGFFYLKDHGFSQELIDDSFSCVGITKIFSKYENDYCY